MWCGVMAIALSVAAQAKPPDRVGRILIEGNEHTPDRAIRPALDLRPGQVIDYRKLGVAKTRLDKLGLFNAATVEVIPNDLDSAFKDIRIRVEERSWTWLTFAFEDTVAGAFTLDAELLRSTAYRVRVKLRGRAP